MNDIMKVKKIRNIDKSVCSCEQKIAYNFAFRYRDVLEYINKSDAIVMVKDEAFQRVIRMVESSIKEQEIDKKYNIDAIIHAFRNGIEQYLQGYTILNSYKDIGKIFTISYGIE